MKVHVTQADIDSGEDPIEFASERAFGKTVTVERKFMMIEGCRLPFRLPLGVELWYRTWHITGQGKPFSFDIGD